VKLWKEFGCLLSDHSMMLGPSSFSNRSSRGGQLRQSRESARGGADHLPGGLGERRADLSEHLRNRMEVSEMLRSGGVPVTILRAAVILGSGSASYEIHAATWFCPALDSHPKWANSRCSPLACGRHEVPDRGNRGPGHGRRRIRYRGVLDHELPGDARTLRGCFTGASSFCARPSADPGDNIRYS